MMKQLKLTKNEENNKKKSLKKYSTLKPLGCTNQKITKTTKKHHQRQQQQQVDPAAGGEDETYNIRRPL